MDKAASKKQSLVSSGAEMDGCTDMKTEGHSPRLSDRGWKIPQSPLIRTVPAKINSLKLFYIRWFGGASMMHYIYLGSAIF